MAKSKSLFFCKNCGYQSSQWLGKCPSCGEWSSFVEEVIDRGEGQKGKSHLVKTIQNTPKRLDEISLVQIPRIGTGYSEFDNVLGGGIVAGSITLLGGEPGIGKSTLLLQMVLKIKEKRILYISGEESEAQLKMRAERLCPGYHPDNLFILTETSTQDIFEHIKNVQPELLVIDSIQTLQSSLIDSAAGSISQIKECAAEFQHYAKTSAVPVFLIGHITKDGSLAGPKILEHIVDTVLQFEGDQQYMYRILRAQKNRFGSTSELGIYEMRQDGLREVSNPSELLLSTAREGLSGISIAAAVEGVRPFLIEVQALVSSAAYGTPQRSSTGFDGRRLNMLLAVLEKRIGFKLLQKDVFLNIAGGLRVQDPAIDLAVLAAVLSSNMDIPLDAGTCLCGEVGLAGEIRPVNRIEQRIQEAQKLGFKRILIPAEQKVDSKRYTIEIVPVRKVTDAFRLLIKNN